MKIVAHLDPVVLEGELLRLIGEVQEKGNRTGPVLVVVPTSRLVDHLQRRLAGKFGAVIGVEIAHFHGLARKIHETNGNGLRAASGRILTELLRRCIGELPDRNRLKRYVTERPGAASSLMSSIRDLREAGIDPDDFRRLARSAPDLARLYQIYCTRLAGLTGHQITDEAGFITAACKVLGTDLPFRDRYAAVFLYGAYELVGVHLDLLRKLEPVTALLPFDPTGQGSAGAYAEKFARRFLMKEGEEAETVQAPERTSLAGERLVSLYDEDSRPPALPSDRISLDDFQGATTEVTWAVRRALASGNDPKEICILARDLSRYGPALEAAFEDLSWTSSLHTPLRRNPAVHDALVLLQVVADDFPRAPTVELLSSPRIRWDLLTGDDPDGWAPDGAAGDAWSRRAGILSGLKSWTEDLPHEAAFVRDWNLETEEEKAEAARNGEANAERAGRMVRLLSLLHERFNESAPDSWAGHADRFKKMLELLPEQADLLTLLDDMCRLDLFGGDGAVTAGDGLNWLRQAVDDSSLTPWSGDTGGIRVLDAMQARGMTFQEVFFIGFNSGSFPRTGREDPFLGDRLRRDLEAQQHIPLPAGAGNQQEERVLLAQILGSAVGRLHVSWQRADDAGRAVSPSPALRELARVALGAPDPARLLEEQVRHRSVHPRARLDELESETGMLDREQANLLAAFACEGRVPDPDSGADGLGLSRRSLSMLHATERFRFGPTDWDGRIGIDSRPRNSALSTTALEELGRCPLRFFFKRILRVEELEDELSPLDPAPKDMGTAVHKLLEKIYNDLQNEGLFTAADPAALKERGRALLAHHRAGAFRSIRRRRADHLQPLWKVQESIWLDAAGRFLDTDLEALAGLGPVSLELEQYITRQVDLGEGETMEIGGKFDRRLQVDDLVRVSDYKTSGKLDKRTNKSEMLKGNQLQVPVYQLLAEGKTVVELLGVGPAYRDAGEEDARAEFINFDRSDQQDGMFETFRVLAGLLKGGVYPLNEDSKSCDYCVFKSGCRANHPPTLERESTSADGGDYALLSSKNIYRGNTLLKDLRRREGSE